MFYIGGIFMKFFYYYLTAINIYGFFIMYIDKEKAKEHKWRISEFHIFITALLLGSLGVWLGIYTFRHKTNHLKFVIGMPLILLMQVFLFITSHSFFKI